MSGVILIFDVACTGSPATNYTAKQCKQTTSRKIRNFSRLELDGDIIMISGLGLDNTQTLTNCSIRAFKVGLGIKKVVKLGNS